MAFNVSYIYQLADKYSVPLRRIAAATKTFALATKRVLAKVAKFGAALKDLGGQLKDFGGTVSAYVSAPLAALGVAALRQSAILETLGVAFETMTRSAEKGRQVMESLVTFTAKTPFQLEGVAKSAKQLLSFGVAQDALTKRLRMLGDIASGAGVPLSDMAGIFGKIKAKGKAMTEEILQLSDRGIPIVQALAKQFGVTKERIFKMASQGRLSFKVMLAAMQKMTGAGGMFEGMMQKQSQTLAGLFSTIRDNISLALADVGDIIVKAFDLKGNMGKFISFLETARGQFKEFAKANPGLVRLGLILSVVATAAGPLILILGALVAAIGAILSPITLVLAGIAAVAGAFTYWVATGNPVVKVLSDIGNMVWSVAGEFLELFGVSTEGADGMKALAGVFTFLGKAIAVILSPLKVVIRLVTTIIGVALRAADLDFSGAIERAKQGFRDMKADIADAGNIVMGTEIAEGRAGRRAAAVEVSGQIGVAAEPGTRVTRQAIEINQGGNVAMAGAR